MIYLKIVRKAVISMKSLVANLVAVKDRGFEEKRKNLIKFNKQNIIK